MLLHVHKDKTDFINLVDVANNFVGEKSKQEAVFFDKFLTHDVPTKVSFLKKSTQTVAL